MWNTILVRVESRDGKPKGRKASKKFRCRIGVVGVQS